MICCLVRVGGTEYRVPPQGCVPVPANKLEGVLLLVLTPILCSTCQLFGNVHSSCVSHIYPIYPMSHAYIAKMSFDIFIPAARAQLLYIRVCTEYTNSSTHHGTRYSSYLRTWYDTAVLVRIVRSMIPTLVLVSSWYLVRRIRVRVPDQERPTEIFHTVIVLNNFIFLLEFDVGFSEAERRSGRVLVLQYDAAEK